MDNGSQAKALQSPYFQMFAEQFIKANQYRAEMLSQIQSKMDALLRVGDDPNLTLKSRRTDTDRLDKPADFSSMLKEQIAIVESHNNWLGELLSQLGRMV